MSDEVDKKLEEIKSFHDKIHNMVENLHSNPAPETRRWVEELKSDVAEIREHIQKDDTIHRDIFDILSKIQSQLEDGEKKDKERDEVLKPMIEAFNGVSFLGKWGSKSIAFLSVVLGVFLSIMAVIKIFFEKSS